MMEKIKALMLKCNLSEEAANALCTAFDDHEQQMRTKLEEEFTNRFEAAKKICLEETEAYKVELARRTQIFLEANAGRVEQIVAKQAQLREGKAINTLEQVKGMLEGITINPDQSSLEAKALKEQNEKLKKDNAQLTTIANRKHKLAEGVLKRNRYLETQVALVERNEGRSASRQTVAESRDNNTATRLDAARANGGGSARSATTRRTLNENQNRSNTADNRTGNVSNGNKKPNLMTPAQIAASMSDDV